MSFTSESLIKEGIWTKVDEGTFRGKPAIRKQYKSGQEIRFESEVQNLNCMLTIPFDRAVNKIAIDSKIHTLVYQRIEGENGHSALEKNPQEVLARLFWSMVQEASVMKPYRAYPFSFVPERHKQRNEPFFYSFLLRKTQDIEVPVATKEKLTRLLTTVQPEIMWGR